MTEAVVDPGLQTQSPFFVIGFRGRREMATGVSGGAKLAASGELLRSIDVGDLLGQSPLISELPWHSGSISPKRTLESYRRDCQILSMPSDRPSSARKSMHYLLSAICWLLFLN
jgi:hypothetical protein